MRLETERLILREWREDDFAPLGRIMGDAEARPFHPNTLTKDQARQMLDGLLANPGPVDGLRAAELKDSGQIVGLIGFAPVGETVRAILRGHPKVEIGWQLAKEAWGKGLATEGAKACLDYAWETLNLPEIVSFTNEGNLPSRRVMEKIGLTRDPADDFDHPKLPEGHTLRPHVLYRASNPIT